MCLVHKSESESGKPHIWIKSNSKFWLKNLKVTLLKFFNTFVWLPSHFSKMCIIINTPWENPHCLHYVSRLAPLSLWRPLHFCYLPNSLFVTFFINHTFLHWHSQPVKCKILVIILHLFSYIILAFPKLFHVILDDFFYLFLSTKKRCMSFYKFVAFFFKLFVDLSLHHSYNKL